MDFLTKELIKVNGFPIALWHVIVVVAALVLLVIVLVAICRGARKGKKTEAIQTDAPATEPVVVEPDTVVDDEPIVVVDDSNAVQGDTSIVVVDDPDQEEPTDQAVVVVDDPADQPIEQPAETPFAPKRTVKKNYHISLRPDGKWQVKLSKGGKAIKLFDTQAEAIAFAKARAKSQDGHITIHKVDGKIRKQKY